MKMINYKQREKLTFFLRHALVLMRITIVQAIESLNSVNIFKTCVSTIVIVLDMENAF